jgi:hypothetical protein
VVVAEEPVVEAVVEPKLRLPEAGVEVAMIPPVVLPAEFVVALLWVTPLVAVAKQRERMQED